MFITPIIRPSQVYGRFIYRASKYRQLPCSPFPWNNTHRQVSIVSRRYFSSFDEPKLHFPPKEVIISYLSKHPLTQGEFLQEAKIIEIVATVFAGKQRLQANVYDEVLSTIDNEGERLDMPEPAVVMISMNLAMALKDCANNKPIASTYMF